MKQIGELATRDAELAAIGLEFSNAMWILIQNRCFPSRQRRDPDSLSAAVYPSWQVFSLAEPSTSGFSRLWAVFRGLRRLRGCNFPAKSTSAKSLRNCAFRRERVYAATQREGLVYTRSHLHTAVTPKSLIRREFGVILLWHCNCETKSEKQSCHYPQFP